MWRCPPDLRKGKADPCASMQQEIQEQKDIDALYQAKLELLAQADRAGGGINTI